METSEIFIGRKEIRNFLKERVFYPYDAPTLDYCPLVAPRGYGKSLLMRELDREFLKRKPHNVYHVMIAVDFDDDYVQFWLRLLYKFSMTVEVIDPSLLSETGDPAYRFAVLTAHRIHSYIQGVTRKDSVADGFRAKLDECRARLLEAYRRLHIRLIVTVDDFDRAEILGEEFLKGLRDCARPDADGGVWVSIITLSHLWIRAGEDASLWGEPIYLGGFSNEELEEFFESFRELPCGVPPQSVRMNLLYLCGRSPKLLMYLRRRLRHDASFDWDLLELYDQNKRYFDMAYKNTTFMMRFRFTDEWHTTSLIEAFHRQLVDADFSALVDAEGELEVLRQYGYVTLESSENHLFEQLGLPISLSVDETKRTHIYEPLSPYLLDLIRYQKRDT